MLTAQDTIGYPVMEQFYTLQGEGFHTGRAAWFIRLGGCDVGCVWCDVKDSWDAAAYPVIHAAEIAREATVHPSRVAVVTGGEPAMYDLTAMCDSLHDSGFRVHIETSGAYPLSGSLDWVTLSPKKFKPALDETLLLANEVKVIVFHPSDIAWAQQFVSRVSPGCLLYLQPEWSRKEEMTPLIIDFVKQNPQWRLSLQTHKYINIP